MTRNRFLNYLISAVWLVNGLFCKVLNGVPRHRLIVARIIGTAHAAALTRAIGFAEIAMAVWIVSGIRPRLNTITQVAVIATMNTIEYAMAYDLLLWGRWNDFSAFLFLLMLLYNGYSPGNRQTKQA